MPFVCLGQEGDGEVKKDEFSDIYERLAEKHNEKLPDFKLRVWARMLVSPTEQINTVPYFTFCFQRFPPPPSKKKRQINP